MNRWFRHTIVSVLLFVPMLMMAQGMPFVRSYGAEEYQAHNRNFDILAADNGVVYVANFEGLLYYDKAEWHIIHTPGITRITAIYQDQKGRVWTGGYNFVGYLETTSIGTIRLHSMTDENNIIRGEVNYFWEKGDQIYFRVSNRDNYLVTKDGFEPSAIAMPFNDDFQDINQSLAITPDLTLIATNGQGLILQNRKGEMIWQLNEDNGLCNNNVNRISYDGHGTVWGATDKGIFSLAIPSVYSHFTAFDGLKGEVTAIQRLGATMIVGTLNGIYMLHGKQFEEIHAIPYPCWQLKKVGNVLLAATSDGVYEIAEDGRTRQLSNASAMSVVPFGSGFLCGEIDGVYYYTNDQSSKIVDAAKVTKICIDKEKTIWLENLYGQIWSKQENEAAFQVVTANDHNDVVATLVDDGEKVSIVRNIDNDLFPLFSYTDSKGCLWLTDHESKNLMCTKNGQRTYDYQMDMAPFANKAVRAMLREEQTVWIGGEFGLVAIGEEADQSMATTPMLHFCSIKLNGDSIIWENFAPMPEELEAFPSDNHIIELTYALDYSPIMGETRYRTQLNGGAWSPWSKTPKTTFTNLSSGTYTLNVQAIDAFGRKSNIATLEFRIQTPIFLRWYMFIVYLFLLGLLFTSFNKWRIRRLEKEKIRLEKIVGERTAEVIQQKNEIEEKSNSLQVALDELAQAQKKLIRQEKMATAGKLTQGLIDRILNPMNYINNFSKLSCGLLKDLKANIEEEEGNMNKENYEDSIDVINMIDQNLKKVEEHGLSTSRTLKAMEEILKDRSGGMQPMSLVSLIRQNEEMVHTYFESRLKEHGINIVFTYPDTDIQVNGNAEQLSKTFMSMLGNSIYAVEKKCARTKYQPEVSLRLTLEGNMACIFIHDNGTGIEPAIINKIFDPFFTTKTTGEASGVGLYLSHEILQNHGGDITVVSVKNEYTEFKITIPNLPNSK